jgi:hypothetical protein
LKILEDKYKELGFQLSNIQAIDLKEMDRKYKLDRQIGTSNLESSWKG